MFVPHDIFCRYAVLEIRSLMDSKVVARGIKREIWPFLRREEFTEFTSRTAWRRTADQIHVVNYQSFNSYLAEGLGCTTFSFALNLGIFFRAIPFKYPVKGGTDPSNKPQVYHCHFQHSLVKGIAQPLFQRRDIWYVEPDGTTYRSVSKTLGRPSSEWDSRGSTASILSKRSYRF